MKIGVIVYAYILADDLHHLLDHLLAESTAHVYLFLHSAIPQVVRVCQAFEMHERVQYFPYGVNRGLARSVNEALLLGYGRDGCDVMLNCNDDVLPGKGDVEKIAADAVEHRECWLVEGVGICGGRAEGIDISLGALNPTALQTIGYFDENFYPAYFEDTDYRRRAALAGLTQYTVTDTAIIHAGSKSLSQVNPTVHQNQFLRSQRYYINKWGGDRDQEVFSVPFNDPALNICIPAECIHAPYGEHDRRDYEEVLTWG